MNTVGNKIGKKVFVGLSGGVDSAVSATLLKKAGYDVTGVFIKVWQPDWIECSWKEDRRDAMRVAAHLEISFVTLDLEKEYKEGVIDYMITEYAIGRTPNPDVMCNREVKFGAFWTWAKKQGADYIATGHYARIISLSPDHKYRGRDDRSRNNQADSAFSLLVGKDPNKDQSYFLWTLNQTDLKHILFPVGNIPKPEVRKLAKKFKLPNANKKDSQGLCFIGKVDVKEFLTHYIKTKLGNVLDEDNKIIGTHPGALLFTIGERHGFTIIKKTPHDDPYYVISKDVQENTLVVSNKKGRIKSKNNSCEVKLSNCNWVQGIPENRSLQARIRYRQTLENVYIVNVVDKVALLRFEKTQETLTSGQSLVIYNGETCVGGGIID